MFDAWLRHTTTATAPRAGAADGCRSSRVRHSASASGVAQWLACWAHDPKVRGSKPRSATCADMRATQLRLCLPVHKSRTVAPVTWRPRGHPPDANTYTAARLTRARGCTRAEWRSGQRVGLITQRSQDRDLAPLNYHCRCTVGLLSPALRWQCAADAADAWHTSCLRRTS